MRLASSVVLLALLTAAPAAAQGVRGAAGDTQNPVPVRCVKADLSGFESCAGAGGSGSTDADDGSIAAGQTVGLNANLTYAYDGSAGAWKRNTLLALTNSNAFTVAIVDSAATRSRRFGGGTQYATASANAGPTGTLALGYDGANLRALSTNSSGHLNVIFPSAQAVTGSGNFTVIQGTATNLKTQAENYQGGSAVAAGNPLQVTLANTGANTNKLLVTPDSVALPANQSVDVSRFGGSAVATGLGAAGSGVPRVTVSNDDLAGSVSLTAATGTVACPAASATAITTSASCIVAPVSGMQGVAGAIQAGTLAATLLTQASYDGGTTWSTAIVQNGSNTQVGSFTLTNPNAETPFHFLIGNNVSHVRVSAAAFTSGAATVWLRVSRVSSVFTVGALPVSQVGQTPSLFVSTLGATDGTTTRAAVLKNASPANTEYGLIARTIETPTNTCVTTLSGANASVTLTLTAVASSFHYITRITASRTCTTAITGSALLGYTSTNLSGSLAWTAGNACAIGSTNLDIGESYNPSALKSSVANTNTTIVAPAAGAAGQIRLTACYYTGP
jgi:hypothetical protein